jgi:hypothetical protein
MIMKFSGRSEEQGMKAYYQGLGELYLSDGRYTKVNGVTNTAFTQFMQKGDATFCRNHVIIKINRHPLMPVYFHHLVPALLNRNIPYM